jgi:hypothetical protein
VFSCGSLFWTSRPSSLAHEFQRGQEDWAGCCAPVAKPYIWWHAIIVQKLQKHSFIPFFSSTYIYREDEVGRRTTVYCVLSFSWVSHFIRNNSRKWDLSCFRCCKMTVEMYSVHMIWWSFLFTQLFQKSTWQHFKYHIHFSPNLSGGLKLSLNLALTAQVLSAVDNHFKLLSKLCQIIILN